MCKDDLFRIHKREMKNERNYVLIYIFDQYLYFHLSINSLQFEIKILNFKYKLLLIRSARNFKSLNY